MAHEQTLQSYLEQIGTFCQDRYGQQFRSQFRDTRGTAELAMLASPSKSEYKQLCKAVQVMAQREREHPELLSDSQIRDIAERAEVDPGNVQIFINGYILQSKKNTPI